MVSSSLSSFVRAIFVSPRSLALLLAVFLLLQSLFVTPALAHSAHDDATVEDDREEEVRDDPGAPPHSHTPERSEAHGREEEYEEYRRAHHHHHEQQREDEQQQQHHHHQPRDQREEHGSVSLDPAAMNKIESIAAALEVLTPAIANAASKKDINAFTEIFSDANKLSQETLTRAINSARDDTVRKMVTHDDLERIFNMMSAMESQLRRLTTAVEAVSKESGTYSHSLNKQAEELRETIKEHTSFGFWTYFVLFQILVVIGFVGANYMKKYTNEKTKLF